MAGPLPLENTYFPSVNGWVAQMTGKTRARDAYNTELLEKMRGGIRTGGTYNFAAPNAGFEISVASGKGAVAILLSKQVKDEAEFQQLKQSGDAHLHISDKAKWQGAGLYPVGALGARLNARGGTEPYPNIDPYEFLNDPAKFSPQAGKQRKAAFVEMFGLGRGNPTMERIGGAKADRHAGQTLEFPNVQSALNLKNVFSGLGGLWGGGGENSPAPASPQNLRKTVIFQQRSLPRRLQAMVELSRPPVARRNHKPLLSPDVKLQVLSAVQLWRGLALFFQAKIQ